MEESRNERHVGTEQVAGKRGGRRKRRLETAGAEPTLAPSTGSEGKLALGGDEATRTPADCSQDKWAPRCCQQRQQIKEEVSEAAVTLNEACCLGPLHSRMLLPSPNAATSHYVLALC